MDPAGGPWSAYAQYNRLQQQQSGGATSDQQPPPPVPNTAQLIPGSFLSPPPVAAYEPVFTPFLHHAAAAAAAAKPPPPTHYNVNALQHRQVVAKDQEFFDWPQNSPFGILPHETVVPTTSNVPTANNFNAAHFAAAQTLNHLNSHLAANVKNATVRSHSPHHTANANKTTTQHPTGFFQGQNASTFPEASTNNGKTFTSSNNNSSSPQQQQQQQSCIVSSANSSAVSKEYRIPQAPNRTFLSATNNTPAPRNNTGKSSPQSNKSQQNERTRSGGNGSEEPQNQNQNTPISFSIMDAPGRLNYAGSNSSGKRPFPHNYNRHYQQQQPQTQSGTGTQSSTSKNGPDYVANGQDCNVVVPRRPSPLQAHSQPSPIGHPQSPAYPLYNSPNQQQQQQQQGASPLDASLSRNVPAQATQAVAYSSVITRALTQDKPFADRYERTVSEQNQSSSTQPQQANCNWSDRRKFPTNNNQFQATSNNIESTTRSNLPGAERQQATYFENGPIVTLQDLSSCRGDPMTIVKNLQQQQQQTCQIQQPEIKQEIIKKPIKRRLSNEKSGELQVAGRIPPPAHSAAVIVSQQQQQQQQQQHHQGHPQQQQQQQQNGAYFEFDRWNLPPAQKMFAAAAQHQSIMVGHHSHPLPYFAPFHIGPPSVIEHSPSTSANYPHTDPPPVVVHYQPQPAAPQQLEDQPKVVVPNIEEELNFLSEDPKPPPAPAKPAATSSSPGANFMSSYLKFLQGKRDGSPPPIARGARKPNWTRPKVETVETPVEHVNGTPVTAPAPIIPPLTRISTQGDPQDDPRYFPLPKERKRNSFDSSDSDGLSSDDDFFGTAKKSTSSSTLKNDSTAKDKKDDKPRGRKGRPCKPGGPTERKRAKIKEPRTKEKPSKEEKDKPKGAKTNTTEVINMEVPKRETTKRAAKEKKNLVALMKDDDFDEPLEFQDSEDSDPAWTPMAKNEDDEDILPLKKHKRSKPKKGLKNLIAAAAQGAGIIESDMYPVSPNKTKSSLKLTKNKSSQPLIENNVVSLGSTSDENPFKNGDFLVVKSELKQNWPAIWRVDGKTLLQKYEPFEQNGKTVYRNISAYTSWTPESKKQYMSVPVRCLSQGQMEMIVELLKDEIIYLDPELESKCLKEFEAYQDNFEVYIQTLISQALDSNFLMEIFSEKDEYFLSNVRTIDEITEGKKQKLLSILKWPPSLQAAVCTWPCFNVIKELSPEVLLKKCNACGKQEVSVRVLMYGQPYNSTTLEGCQPDPTAMNEKDFLMCRICASRVELSNKITHQKYLMYIECAKKVTEKRSLNSNKDTTSILNELLADEVWLTQLFYNVRTLWTEIECMEHSIKKKQNTVTQ